jgi:hypothetical protein
VNVDDDKIRDKRNRKEVFISFLPLQGYDSRLPTMSRRIPNDSVDAYTTTDQQASPAAGPLKHEASTTFSSFGFHKGNLSKATRGDYSMTVLLRRGTWPLRTTKHHRTTKRGLQVPLWYGGMASGKLPMSNQSIFILTVVVRYRPLYQEESVSEQRHQIAS